MSHRRQLGLLMGLALVSLCVALLAPLASDSPDGLEKSTEGIKESQTTDGDADDNAIWQAAPAPGYLLRGVKEKSTASRLSGLLGTLLAFAVVTAIGKALSRARQRSTPRNSPDPGSGSGSPRS